MAEKKVTNEDLVRLINRGFENTATKADLTEVNTRLGKIEKRLYRIESRLPDNAIMRLEQLEQDMEAVKKAIGFTS